MLARIIAFSGAGISADSGIATFQAQPGIREKLTRSFANDHPDEFAEVMKKLADNIAKAKPNAAHYALAEYDIPVITMNIDGLHQKAGSKQVINVHGDMPNIVLYEDPAPRYREAIDLVSGLSSEDILLIIGASNSTYFAYELRNIALSMGVEVREIQADAAKVLPQLLAELVRGKEET